MKRKRKRRRKIRRIMMTKTRILWRRMIKKRTRRRESM